MGKILSEDPVCIFQPFISTLFFVLYLVLQPLSQIHNFFQINESGLEIRSVIVFQFWYALFYRPVYCIHKQTYPP